MNLLKLLDRPITFHRCFVDLTGSINAALMLSQAVYWTNRLPEDREGWFHKTQEEWEEETGLTRREHDKARLRLIELGLWESQRAKVSASDCVTALWHRVNLAALQNQLETLAPTKWRKAPIGPTKGRKTPDQMAESANCSPFRSKNIDYTQTITTTTARATREIFADWLPEPKTLELLAAEGMSFEFAASCIPEFVLYWLTRQEARTEADWNTAFVRQVRSQFAYQQRQQQEQSRHDADRRRNLPQSNPSQSGRQGKRRETLHERNLRYQRVMAGGSGAIENADSSDGEAIRGEFWRH